MSDQDTAADDVETPGGEQSGADTQATDKKPGGDAASATLTAGDDGDSKAAPDWPEDWREKLAGGDEKLAKRLARFQSPRNVLQSWLSADQKIRSGELRAPLPENPTDEQIAEYRKANGIPETPAEYLDALPEGLVLGDDDKPILSAFAEKMHAHNLPPAAVSDAVQWYLGEVEAQQAQAVEDAKARAQEAEDTLRAEWGAEYRANMNAVENFRATLPDGLGDALWQATLPDGSVFGGNAAAVRWLRSVAEDMNPGGTLAPGDAQTALQSVGERIKEIERIMRDDRKRYEREGMRDELMQLYDRQEKMKARAA